jgi:hypothetical protein
MPDLRRYPVIVVTLCYALAACQDSSGPEPFKATLDEAICAPTAGPFSSTITNPYFPAAVGRQWVLDGTDQGKAVHLQVTALNSTELVAGVTTQVVEERETVDGALLEDGTVCYYGEDVDIYAGGVITSHEGQWRAGVGGALPGILMPASPAVGQAFVQEIAPGVAQDRVEVLAAGESVIVPYGTFTNTIRFRETSPLEPGVKSTKVYVQSLGPIVDDEVRLTGKTP